MREQELKASCVMLVFLGTMGGFLFGRYITPHPFTEIEQVVIKVVIKESDEKKCKEAGGEIVMDNAFMGTFVNASQPWECRSKLLFK